MAYSRVNWQNSPSTSTPINATNLNNMDSAIKEHDNKLLGSSTMGNIVVDSIRTKNMLDQTTISQGDITSNTQTTRLNSRQVLWLEVGTYTFSCPNITATYDWGIQIQNIGIPPLSSWPTMIYETGWISGSTKTKTFTISTAGWFTLMLRKSDNSAIIPTNVSSFNFQLEKGSTATSYSPYQQLDRPTIQRGSGIVDSSYIDTVEFNHWEKYGNVVSYSFTMKVKGTWNTTTKFITGLPRATTYTRLLGTNASNGNAIRFAIEENGDLRNAYSVTTPTAGQTIEGHLVYISKD